MKPRSRYRQLWEKNNGPIPNDEQGRPYDIHHIDNDAANNNINNLKCVSLQEHYNIHFAQKDYWACQAISIRLSIPEEERRTMLALSAIQRRGIPRPDIRGDLNPMRNKEVAKKLSIATKGYPKTEEGRKAIGDSQRNRLSKKINCIHCNKIMDEMNHNRWHGNKCRSKI